MPDPAATVDIAIPVEPAVAAALAEARTRAASSAARSGRDPVQASSSWPSPMPESRRVRPG